MSSTLVDRYPFLFEGLKDEEIELRLEYFRVAGISVVSTIEAMRDRDAPALAPEEAAYRCVISRYRQALRTICERAGCEEVADEIDDIAALLQEAAAHGRNRAEQRASLMFRHPGLRTSVKLDGRSFRGRRRWHLIAALRLLRDHSKLKESLHESLARRPKLRPAREALRSSLLKTYPELSGELERPEDVRNVTPDLAARTILGARLTPAVSAETVSTRLSEARKIVVTWQNLASGGENPDSTDL